MKILKHSFGLLMMLILSGCAIYMVPQQSLFSQLKENQRIAPNLYFQQFALVDYPSNNLQKIKCIDKYGTEVWLYPDKNTEFIITRKSDGKDVTTYFDTLILQNDTLYGLRSRLVGGLRIIPVKDVGKVIIYSEVPRVVKVNE
jgi:hypothetical protein